MTLMGSLLRLSFNTQPPEGGCKPFWRVRHCLYVSTHSRPKAAALKAGATDKQIVVSTHSRPKAAAGSLLVGNSHYVSFNTQPPEGGCLTTRCGNGADITEFQHTAARRRLPKQTRHQNAYCLFQHTAARRRLLSPLW